MQHTLGAVIRILFTLGLIKVWSNTMAALIEDDSQPIADK